MSEALLQMAVPFRSLSVMEQVGSYSPEWVLGSVQAAAVNEVFPPPPCWGFWLSVHLPAVSSAHVPVSDHTWRIGKLLLGNQQPKSSWFVLQRWYLNPAIDHFNYYCPCLWVAKSTEVKFTKIQKTQTGSIYTSVDINLISFPLPFSFKHNMEFIKIRLVELALTVTHMQ